MKKFLTVLVLFTVVSITVKANDDKPKATAGMAVVKTGSVFKLYYKGVKAGDVKVTIYNPKDVAVFTETIRKIESFVRPYNFSTLEEGEYTLKLSDEEGTQLQKISYTNGRLEKLMNLTKVVGTRDKYILSVPNKGSEKLHIRIYSGETLVYNTTETITGDFAKVYNLEKIGSAFAFEVTDQQGVSRSLTYHK